MKSDQKEYTRAPNERSTLRRPERLSVTLGEDLIAYLRQRDTENASDISTELRQIILRESRGQYTAKPAARAVVKR